MDGGLGAGMGRSEGMWRTGSLALEHPAPGHAQGSCVDSPLLSLQEEMGALQARMSVLAAKDQQLRREMDLQQQLLRWRDCDLRPLLDRLTPSKLQEIHQAARDTLALAGQVPLPGGPPEAVRR